MGREERQDSQSEQDKQQEPHICVFVQTIKYEVKNEKHGTRYTLIVMSCECGNSYERRR